MTTLAHRTTPLRRANGGVAARRAIVRWAWRMFRRERRQQFLLLALLSVAVAAATASVTIAYNSGAADDAEFGSASHLLRFEAGDQLGLEPVIAKLRERFGTVDLIGRRSLPVPGSADPVEFRSQDPRGAYGGTLLGLREGGYPASAGEVAITDGVATMLGLQIGGTLALDGGRRTVTGIVENPRDLSDEFALVTPSSAKALDQVTVLVDANADSVDAFARSAARGDRSAFRGSEARPSTQATTALAMFGVATVFLLLATLVASAGFAVIAQRRLRQIGALAAVGASDKQLRLALLTNGALVGTIGALIGAGVGLALWLAIVPTIEPAAGHRIDPLSLPWTLLAATALVAVLGATAAAWWPGRMVARVPVTLALSARPPRPRATRHPTIVAVALIAAGVGALVLSGRDSEPLIAAGLLATIAGTLLLAPLAIRLFAGVGEHAPVAVRLALRDLTRQQARSGAALAAITLALGIAAAVVVVGTAEQEKSAGEPPNLSDRQIRVYTGATQFPDFVPTQPPAVLDRMGVGVRELAAALGGAAVTPLRSAYQTAGQPGSVEGIRGIVTEVLKRKVDDPDSSRWSGRAMSCWGPAGCYVHESRLYVATPALLRSLGIDPAGVAPRTDFLADRSVPVDELVTTSERPSPGGGDPEPVEQAVTNVQRIESTKRFGAPEADTGLAPASFITRDALRRRGWRVVPSGWLVESGRPLTGEQIDAARELAAGAGLRIEVRREPTSQGKLIGIATAAGALLALCVLAMTVGLIRSEGAADLRTLTATGATNRTRRTLTAVTAGALAFLGALLGVAGAYIALVAIYLDDLGYLARIPALYLVLICVGVPLAAIAAGWLLAGREPPAIARPAIE